MCAFIINFHFTVFNSKIGHLVIPRIKPLSFVRAQIYPQLIMECQSSKVILTFENDYLKWIK